MFEKQGLRLLMDGMGPGYAFEVNTLQSMLNVFIGDAAAEATANAEMALEKSTATRGLLAVQYNEPDLYGYTDENIEAAAAFRAERDGMLPVRYGLEIAKLVMAAYMSSEKKKTIDLTDPAVQQELETYIPLIQQGRGAEVLYLVWVIRQRTQGAGRVAFEDLDKYFDQLRVKLRAFAAAQFFDCLDVGAPLAVDTVVGHRAEGVHNGQDARANRDFLPSAGLDSPCRRNVPGARG
jgi:hypothetical protein